MQQPLYKRNEIVLKENNCYPMARFAIRAINASEPAERYKFLNKEYEESFALNVTETDFRQYNPAIGRWVVQDPVVHHDFSPYSAFDNNPVFWRDPSGANAIQSGIISIFRETTH